MRYSYLYICSELSSHLFLFILDLLYCLFSTYNYLQRRLILSPRLVGIMARSLTAVYPQNSNLHSPGRVSPRPEIRIVPSADNIDLCSVDKELRILRENLFSIRTQDPREIIVLWWKAKEINSGSEITRGKSTRKNTVFTPGLDTIHEAREESSFDCSQELRAIQSQEEKTFSSESESQHQQRTLEEGGMNPKPENMPQSATSRAGASSIKFRCELTDESAESLSCSSREDRKFLYAKYFTLPPFPGTSRATRTNELKEKSSPSQKGFRGKWTDPNAPKEKNKLWAFWEPRWAALSSSTTTPSSTAQPLSKANRNASSSRSRYSTSQDGRKSRVTIQRVKRLPGPLPPNNNEDDPSSDHHVSGIPAAGNKNPNPQHQQQQSAQNVPFTPISAFRNEKSKKKEKKEKSLSSLSSSTSTGTRRRRATSLLFRWGRFTSSSTSTGEENLQSKSNSSSEDKRKGKEIDDDSHDADDKPDGSDTSSGTSTVSLPPPRSRNVLRLCRFLGSRKDRCLEMK